MESSPQKEFKRCEAVKLIKRGRHWVMDDHEEILWSHRHVWQNKTTHSFTTAAKDLNSVHTSLPC